MLFGDNFQREVGLVDGIKGPVSTWGSLTGSTTVLVPVYSTSTRTKYFTSLRGGV